MFSAKKIKNKLFPKSGWDSMDRPIVSHQKVLTFYNIRHEWEKFRFIFFCLGDMPMLGQAIDCLLVNDV